MKYRCDECGKENEVEYFTDKKVNGIEITYLKCSRCCVKYTCYVTNNKVRKMINENKRLRERKLQTVAESEQVVKNDGEIEKRMKVLKKRYG